MNTRKVIGWAAFGGLCYGAFHLWGKQAIAAYNLKFRFNNVHYKGRGDGATDLKFELLIDVWNDSIFDLYVKKFDFEILFNHENISVVSKEQNTLLTGNTILTVPILVNIDLRTTWETLLAQITSGYWDNWLFEVKGTIATSNIKIPLNLSFNYYDFFKVQ